MISSDEIFMQEREQQQLLHDTTEQQRQSFVMNVIQQIEEGTIDPLKVQLQIKGTESIIDLFATNTRFRSLLLEAAEKHGRKFDLHNATFQIAEAGVKYDYSKCGDPVLKSLHAQMEELKKEVKKREDFVKAAPVSGIQVLADGGEVVTIYPPAKSSTTIVRTTIH